MGKPRSPTALKQKKRRAAALRSFKISVEFSQINAGPSGVAATPGSLSAVLPVQRQRFACGSWQTVLRRKAEPAGKKEQGAAGARVPPQVSALFGSERREHLPVCRKGAAPESSDMQEGWTPPPARIQGDQSAVLRKKLMSAVSGSSSASSCTRVRLKGR